MKDLYQFAYFPNLSNFIDQLAQMAQKEDGGWEYKYTKSTTNKPILRNYLNYTFKRLTEEEKVIESSSKACFNTGLITENQEEIFILFKKNNYKDQQDWVFNCFCKKSDFNLREFNPLPKRSSYFEDSKHLVYDLRLGDPRIDYDHIMDNPENRQRFPESYKSMTNYELQGSLEIAIQRAVERVKRNYKAAVPQFFWDRKAVRGELQLLLPLCMTNPSRADVALVVNRTDDVYSGETILTLDMAYNNARLLARPDTEWLQP